eukprot:g4849.t1
MVNRHTSLAFLFLLDALHDVAGVGVQSFKRLRPRSFLARFWPAADLPPWYEQSNQQQLVHQLQQRQQGVDADFPTEVEVDAEDSFSSTSGGISDSEASRSVLFHTLSGRTVAVPSGSTGVEAKELVAKALGIDEVRQRLSLQLTTSSSSTASSEGEQLKQVQICDSDVLDVVAVADFGERGPGERHDVTLTRLQRSRPTEPERRIAKAATVILFRAPEGETRGTVVVQKRTLLLTGSTNRTARLWDVDRCRLLQTFEGHTQTVGKTCFLPACGCSEVAGLAPEPGGSRLGVLRVATQAWNGTTRVWNAKTGQCEMLLDSRFWLDEGSVNPESYWTRVLSDDGKIMLTVSDTESHLDCRYFSGCDETLLLTTSNKAAAIWNTESGKLVAAVELRLRTNNSAQSGSDHARRGAQQRAENDRPDAREAPKAGEDVGGTDGKNKKLVYRASGTTLRALSPHGTRALFQLEGDARSRSGSSSNRGSLLCITTPSSAPPSCSGIVGGGGQESMRRDEEVVGRGAEELHRRRASTLSPEEPIVLAAPEDTWYKRTVGWVQVAGFANDYIVAQPQLSRRLLVWDATTGEFHGYLDGHQDRVNTMACL